MKYLVYVRLKVCKVFISLVYLCLMVGHVIDHCKLQSQFTVIPIT